MAGRSAKAVQELRRVRRRDAPAPRFKWLGLAWGLCAGGLLVYTGSALALGAVPSAVEGEASRIVSEGGYGWAQTTISGQGVTVSGVAPDQASADELLRQLRAAACPTLVGAVSCVTKVTNQIEIAPPPPPPSHYTLTLARDRAGSVRVSGELPSEELRTQATVALKKRFPNAKLALRVREGRAYGDLSQLLTQAAESLDFLKPGRLELKQGKLSVLGETAAPSALAKQRASLRGLPSEYRIASSKVLVLSDLRACEQRLAEVLKQNKIRFVRGKADVLPRDQKVLDRLAKVAQTCEGEFEVEGHTDSIGSASANQQLSLARAEVVVRALESKGLRTGRFHPRGLGETRPVSNNWSNKGRALNRRIEFRARLLGEL